jgi:diguanylate cyclase (GGDEF)-like protein
VTFFIIMMINIDSEQLATVAEKLRMLVENSYIQFEGSRITVTISIGATLTRPDDTPESLLKRADNLLYQSKREGRNRVTVEAQGMGE